MKVKFCSIVGVIGSSVMAFVDKGGSCAGDIGHIHDH